MQKLYSIKELASIIGLSTIRTRVLVTYCVKCNQSYKKCKCDKFEPAIPAVNLARKGSKRAIWRIEEDVINEILNTKRVNRKVYYGKN